MKLDARTRRAVVAIAGYSLVLQGPLTLAARQSQPATKPAPTAAPPAAPATQKPGPPKPAAPQQPIDGGWPRIYDLPSGGSILLYQPQIASWDQQKKMVA